VKPVRISREAERELLQSIEFYDERRQGLGERFAVAVQGAISTIQSNPLRKDPQEDGTRHYLLRSFPFIIQYLDQPEEIWIVAGAHTSRKPGYWRERSENDWPNS